MRQPEIGEQELLLGLLPFALNRPRRLIRPAFKVTPGSDGSPKFDLHFGRQQRVASRHSAEVVGR